jgi:hypothetical protein
MFGATVKRFVLTVEYPRLATICGRKLLTLARGTPNDRLISAHILWFIQHLFSRLMTTWADQYVGSLNGRKASRMLSFSSTVTEESASMRALAMFFSRSLSNHQVEGERGSQKYAKMAKETVLAPI